MLTTQSRPQKSQFLAGPRKKSKKRTDRLAWGSSMAATTCSRGQATASCCTWRLGLNRWKTTTRQAHTAPASARSHEARCSSIRYWHRGLSKYMHVRASRMLHCRRASRNSLTKAPRGREACVRSRKDASNGRQHFFMAYRKPEPRPGNEPRRRAIETE